MADRPLDPDGQALWQRVAGTVRPLAGRRSVRAVVLSTTARARSTIAVDPPSVPSPGRPPGETLDGGWDRRLRRGVIEPDFTLDLHGHTLAGAHAALERGIGQARARGARLLLLITGRPPRETTTRGDGRPVRGVIRAAVWDWLAQSPHAGAIAAVRAAHPRHGGAGALYVVLRRPR